MAAEEVTNLDRLFHQFVTKWRSRRDFVRLKDPTALDENTLSLIYEATSALQFLRAFIEDGLHRGATTVAWREFVEEFEGLMKYKASNK